MKPTLLVSGLAALMFISPVNAADLGGNCCADLEERIAELEATVAKKGNRKMSLQVYGQMNKAVMWWDVEDTDNTHVLDNSANPSYVGFAGSAKFGAGSDWAAGYVLEIGVGGRDVYGALSFESDDVYVHRSFVYVQGPVGTLSLGKQSQATDNLDLISTANTTVAVRSLSLRPITGPGLSDAADLWDGGRGDVVRYDSPTFAGFVLSAAWSSDSITDDDIWDVALRYAGEFGGFKVAAGVGYRSGVIVDLEPFTGSLGVGETPEVFTAIASVMHVQSGIFATVHYGDLSFDTADLGFPGFQFDTSAWAVTAGIEQKWVSLGKTTLFGEWAEAQDDLSGIDYWGLGVVQNIDGHTDIYLNARQYDFFGTDVDVVTGGARVKF